MCFFVHISWYHCVQSHAVCLVVFVCTLMVGIVHTNTGEALQQAGGWRSVASRQHPILVPAGPSKPFTILGGSFYNWLKKIKQSHVLDGPL